MSIISKCLLSSPIKPYFRCRFHSFATPEAATVERRRRKLRLGIPPPLPSLSHLRPPLSPPTPPPHRNPNAPKLPETLISQDRLVLHNSILSLIASGDLDEAAALVRHSLYSFRRPSAATCNAALSALLYARRPSDLLALHRFVLQAGVPPNVATHNLVLKAHCFRRNTDTALEYYRVILRDSPFTPSPTTYRILVEHLVEESRLDDAMTLKNHMADEAFCAPDPTVYNFLMKGFVENGNPDQAINLYEELREKTGGGIVLDGVIHGNLMKAYFKKGMDEKAVEWYNEVTKEGSKVRFKARSYNSMVAALSENGEFGLALGLFDRMMGEHDPPMRLSVDLESFNLMVDGFCRDGRFGEAIEVFKRTGEKKCRLDKGSYNNLIGRLGREGMVAEAEGVYREMGECGCSPDEFTCVSLMETCFGASKIGDAIGYFNKIGEIELRPSTEAYNKVIGGLLNVGKLDEAKGFFDEMVEKKVKPDVVSYEMLVVAFCEAGRVGDALIGFKDMLMDDGVVSRPVVKELMEASLRKEGREEELGKLVEEVEREKAEALARAAEEKARAEAVAREEAERRKVEAAKSVANATRLRLSILGMSSSSAAADGALEGEVNASGTGEATMDANDGGDDLGASEEVVNGRDLFEETEGGVGNDFKLDTSEGDALNEVRNDSS